MALKTINIKITRQRIETLHSLYAWMISVFAPENNLDHLLKAHTVAMYWRLEGMLQKEFNSITLKVNETEAIAFCLLWGDWNIDHDPLGKVIVNEVIGKIDRMVKNIKRISNQ